MVHILESVIFIKKTVSQVGTSGILYNKVLQTLHTNNRLGNYDLEKFMKLGIHIARNYLSNDGYLFKLENGESFINIIDFNEEDLLQIYDNLICFAPLPDIWKEFGIENISDIPPVDSPIHDLLQRTIASKYNGFIVSENISNGHHNMDKLVHSGLLVKRIIQIKHLSKSTIIHSKFFAKNFDPSKHGYKLVVHRTYLERIIKRILLLLDKNNLDTIPVKNLASNLGLNQRDMQYIRYVVTSLNKSTSFCGIHFYQTWCNPRRKDGSLESLQNLYCVSKVAAVPLDYNIEEYVLNFQCQRNLPIYETIAFAIENKNGITSNQLRKIIGCNNAKKIQKIFFELNKKLGYRLEKIQDGKHIQFKLVSKPVESNTLSVQPVKDSILLNNDISHNNVVSTANNPLSVGEMSSFYQEDQSLLLSNSYNYVQKSEINQSHLLTDEQKLHAKIICDHLSKDDSTIGLYTLSDLYIEVKSFYRKQSQHNGAIKIDKQTINRLLTRLESDHRIECLEIVDPQNSSNNKDDNTSNTFSLIKLYKLKDHKSPDESITNYIKHTTANDIAMQERKRERDTVTKEHSSSKFRKLTKSCDVIDDTFIFDKITIDYSDNQLKHNNLCSTGICVSSISLHHHLLQILLQINHDTTPTVTVTHDDDSMVHKFMLDNVQQELPLYFFLKFTCIFNLAEFDKEYVQRFIKCSNEGMTAKDWLQIESSVASSNHFNLFLNNITTKFEFVLHICFLVSIGILEVVDFDSFYIYLLHYLKNSNIHEIIGLNSLLINDNISINDNVTNQFHQVELFTKLFEYLNGLNYNKISLNIILLNYIFSIYFRINIIPLGSLNKITSSLDIYNHWKMTVLPSIPFDWDSFVISNRLSTVGFHTLIHNIKTSRCIEIDMKQIEQDINMRGIKVLKSSMLHQWGCRRITNAWRDVNLLHWKSLYCYSSIDQLHADNRHKANYTYSSTATNVNNNNENNNNNSNNNVNNDRSNNNNVNNHSNNLTRSTPIITISTKPVKDHQIEQRIDLRSYFHDEQLELEITACFSSSDDEFSTRQIAILLEAFLLSYINKQSAGVLPVPLQFKQECAIATTTSINELTATSTTATMIEDVVGVDAINTSSGSYLDIVNPLVSCLDIVWKDIDFTFVSDSAISLAVSASKTPIYLNSSIRKRLIKFLRIKPKLTHIVAWIVCNKGSLPGNSFRNTTNLVLNKNINFDNQQTNRIMPLVIEHCICAYNKRRNITDFLKKNYSSDIIKKVFRELFIRGYIKKRKLCDHPDCSSDSYKPGYRCTHQKHYELTEAFYDSTNNILLSPFYRTLIKYKESNGLKSILTGIIKYDLFKDNFPAQLASLYNCISRNPNICMNEINIILNDDIVKVSSFNLEDEIINLSNDKVLFRKENNLSRGSTFTFCQRQLNNIEIKAFIHIDNKIVSNNNNNNKKSNETKYSNNSFINYNIFELFAAKALAIISENPGITCYHLHTHLNLLNKNQIIELTRIMEEQNLITSKNCINKIHLLNNPFDIKKVISQQSKLKKAQPLNQTMSTESCFFIQNNFS